MKDKILSNPLINLDDEGVTDNCVECNCLLTEYEKDVFKGVCESCWNDLHMATHPAHPDSGRAR